jgi:hypothetical protein
MVVMRFVYLEILKEIVTMYMVVGRNDSDVAL